MRVYDEADTVKLWLRPGLRNELTRTLEAAGDTFNVFSVKERDTITKLRYKRKSRPRLQSSFLLQSPFYMG